MPLPSSPPKRTPKKTSDVSPARSIKNSFNRLYEEGMQAKQLRAQAVVDGELAKTHQELQELQNFPRISEISNAVAEAMPARQKKNGAS